MPVGASVGAGVGVRLVAVIVTSSPPVSAEPVQKSQELSGEYEFANAVPLVVEKARIQP